MVLRKKKVVKNKVGFGSSTDRNTFHAHPLLDTNKIYKKPIPALDPTRYTPKDINEIYKVNKNSILEPWTCKVVLESWSRNLGYRNQNILAQRKWQSTVLGPAWYEIKHPTKYEPECKNKGFGKAPRFKTRYGSVPAPGTYYRSKPFKAPYGPHSARPTFDREAACRFKDSTAHWKPAPGHYNVIDTDSIENKPKKVVSLLGPYQLFTVKRDLTTIISKTNPSKVVSSSTWPLMLPGSFETYEKSEFGKFCKTNKDTVYRGRNALIDLTLRVPDKDAPGPGSYASPEKVFKQNMYAFNYGCFQPRNYRRVEVWPAVGRYNVAQKHCIPGRGHRHCFISKVPRKTCNEPEVLNTF